MKRLLVLALAACIATSCAAPKPKSSADMAARPLSVQAPGALADAPTTALSPRELAVRVHDLERSGRSGAATRLAATHADVARAALESVTSKPDPSARSLAAAVDRANASGLDVWSPLIALRLREPARFTDFDAAHAVALEAFANGDLDAARASLPLPVPLDTPGSARLAAISDRLEGLAALAGGDAQRAMAAFRRPRVDPALYLVLATAAAERGSDASATAASRDAALAALVDGALARPRWREPALLERLLEEDADLASIAPAVAERLEFAAARDLGIETLAASERALELDSLDFETAPFSDASGAGWTVAGIDRLARGEARAALTDLRRAEQAARDPLVRARLREAQARALLALGEPAAARGILAVLAADADPRAARPALATLGAIELRLERPDLAVGLLRRALEGADIHWPGASAAEANLGLALITAGVADEGLRRLHSAQARFLLEHDYDALALALDNERLAHEMARREAELALVRARIAAEAGL